MTAAAYSRPGNFLSLGSWGGRMARTTKRIRWTTVLRLIFAGWHPRRNVWGRLKLPGGFEVFPEAERVLGRFGGLRFGDRNEHARLDPSVGDEEVGRINECVGIL